MVEQPPRREPIKLGVIGHPIAQSLSPVLHNPWMAEAGIDGSYERIDGGDLGFEATVKACQASGFTGLNVTIPYKGDALAYADHLSDAAKTIGAANFLHFRPDGVYADNTDARGFVSAVSAPGFLDGRQKARVLGAGGAAPAVLYGLRELGFRHIEISNRTEAKALELKDRFDTGTVIPWDDRDANGEDIDLLVNATSLGMKGAPALEFDLQSFGPRARVVDIVTTPLETPLLAAARARGLTAMNGIAMLLHQAVPSFEAWLGQSPTQPEKMIAVIENELAKRP